MSKTAVTDLFERYGHLLPDVQEQYLQTEKEQMLLAFDHWDGRESFEKFYDRAFTPKTGNNG